MIGIDYERSYYGMCKFADEILIRGRLAWFWSQVAIAALLACIDDVKRKRLMEQYP